MPPAAPPPALEAGLCALIALGVTAAFAARRDAAQRRRRRGGGGGGGVGDAGEERAAIRALRSRYLAVYLPAVLADWIQGPYLYALYRAYGFDMTAIAHIFMAGYAASAVVGTVVASLGDSYGHRRSVLVYALTYCLCCLSKFSSSYCVLLLGRLCGGLAYSILYSSFESWAVEQSRRMLPGGAASQARVLEQVFSDATTANAATAVVAGAVGQLAVNTAVAARGYDSAEAAVRAGVNPFVAPFVIALLSLGATFAGASTLWHAAERAYARSGESAAAEGTDDGGDGNSKGIVVAIGKPELPTRRHRRAALASLREALRKLRRDPALIALGTMNALYEAAMYTFVFMWTPALEKRAARVAVHGSDLSGGGVPHGLIFSAFMLSKMAGAQIYSALANRLSPQAALAGVFGVAVPCLLVPVALPSMYAPTLLAFCIFELTLGVYWPTIAVLRAHLVDDGERAATMSLFRIPLNGMLVAILAFAPSVPEGAVFVGAVTLLAACGASNAWLSADPRLAIR